MTLRTLLVLCVALSGCAVSKPDFASGEDLWMEMSEIPDSSRAVEYSLFLVGDMGDAATENGKKTLNLLKQKLHDSVSRQGVVFLGDNVYPFGLPKRSDLEYDDATKILDIQLEALKGFTGDIYYLPGEHDWQKYGSGSLERMDDYIEDALDRKGVFQPDAGCSDPQEEDLTDKVKLMIIDTQWYLENWDEDDEFNKGCDISSRRAFMEELADELGKSRDKTVILAMHHPMFSYGHQGGQSSLLKTIFPFGGGGHEKRIPIPFISSFLQRHIGLPQSIINPRYQELRDEILSITKNMPNVTLVAAHDHNMQYIEKDGQSYIVSGSGSRSTPANAGGFARYTSGSPGFAEIRFYEDKSAWVYFWNSENQKLEYTTQIHPPAPAVDTSFEEYYTLGDSITRTLFSIADYPGKFHRSMWGELNRPLYYDTITAPVFRLEEYHRALTPVRRGGGNQTNSLRLIDTTGQTYVLRSVVKDGRRVMGGVFQGTIVVDLLEDLFTYGHPFAAFSLEPMAEAADIYHTKPKLVYVPKQPALGEFNNTFGGEFYLFEKRADEDASAIDHFGNSPWVVNYSDAMEELELTHRNILDPEYTLRSRLFDLMIGDWDRHQDNWRFATFPIDSAGLMYTIYRPIPRDRDHVYSRFDGPLLQIFNKTIPRGRQFQSFEAEVKRMKWYGEFPKFYDRRFVGSFPWKAWEKEIAKLQQNVHDSLIEKGIKQMPDAAMDYNGQEIIDKIKTRKENLKGLAREFYLVLAENVDVLGTQEDNRFEIQRYDDSTSVRVFAEDDDKEYLMYERIFYHDETKEIRLYGLEGEDKFELKGKGKNGILLRIVGGYDEDEVEDESKVNGIFRKTLVYDHPEGMDIDGGPETEDNTSRRYDFNNYDYKDFNFDYGFPLPYASYDPDFGLRAGVVYTHHTYGYKRRPKASEQSVRLIYAFGNQSLAVGYDGRFNNVFNYTGMLVNASYHGPQFTINYFGPGNESDQDEEKEREFYQVRQSEIYLATGIIRPLGHNAGFISLQPFYRRVKTQNSSDRFISQYPINAESGFNVYEPLQFYGGLFRFQYDSRNSKAEPTQGMLHNLKLRYSRSIEIDQNTTSLMGTLSFYQRLDAYEAVVWATQFGAEHIFGDYMFFQSAYVGGKTSLRGYREGRFRGRTAFWSSNDLRFNLGKVKNPIVPFNAGVFGSGDVGRVWLDSYHSKIWHLSVGGGAFINILDAMTLTLGYHRGSEEGQFLASFGFNF